MNRSQFLKLSAVTALFPALGFPSSFLINPVFDNKKAISSFIGDGLNLSPTAYVKLLSELTAKATIEADNYSRGGTVEVLEKTFAGILGKEAAIFMPTGTLANHLAISALAGENRRIIVQEESHVYNDTGDACQSLSNLNLIPLGAGKATFTLDEVNHAIKKAESGRVASKIGVISIESPVRRKSGEVFNLEEMKKISGFAHEKNIKMHLDGARIFLESAYTGISVKEYAALFDTVYVSLYKYFNAASGAILAGSKEFIGPMYHVRRKFGGGLSEAWPYAAVAGYYAAGFSERYEKSVAIAEEFIKKIQNKDRFAIHRITSGTNIFKLEVKGIAIEEFVKNLKVNGVIARADNSSCNCLLMQVNESLLTTNAAELENIFMNSLNN